MPATNKRKAVRKADPVDVRVGGRLKARRLELKISQSVLADVLGVTFQQVQKYEKGRNRIGASRLQKIASFLRVDPSYFFGPSKVRGDADLKELDEFVTSDDGRDLMRAMVKVTSRKTRIQIVRLVESLAADQDTTYKPLRRRPK